MQAFQMLAFLQCQCHCRKTGIKDMRPPDKQDIYLHIAFNYIQNCRTFTFPKEATQDGWMPEVSFMIISTYVKNYH